MIISNFEVKSLFDDFNKLIVKAEKIAVFTRNIELQNEQINKLSEFIENATKLKNQNKEKFSEPELNLILCLIISADAVKSEISMVISLKNNEMHIAWGHLVQAQNSVSIVARNHPMNDGEYLNGYVAKLNAFEKTLFPSFIFASTGGIIKKSICGICKSDYEECDHIKGTMYFGELCVREIHEMELEEVSLVKNPADKMCIQLSVDFEGKSVDPFTLVEKTTGNTV